MTKKRRYTFIDLFAGCGGLSEGFYRSGFQALAHVEMNHWACETLRKRMNYYGYKSIEKEVIEHDITSDDIIKRLELAVDSREVDIICATTDFVVDINKLCRKNKGVNHLYNGFRHICFLP